MKNDTLANYQSLKEEKKYDTTLVSMLGQPLESQSRCACILAVWGEQAHQGKTSGESGGTKARASRRLTLGYARSGTKLEEKSTQRITAV